METYVNIGQWHGRIDEQPPTSELNKCRVVPPTVCVDTHRKQKSLLKQ